MYNQANLIITFVAIGRIAAITKYMTNAHGLRLLR